MRISLLEKRENFYGILEDTLSNSTLFSDSTNQLDEFYVNKYLNFISSKSLPNSTFKVLKKEYSNSLSWWKKYFQYFYVVLAIDIRLRTFFSQKKLILPRFFKNFLIIGGNHRIRIIPRDLSSCIVLLKSNENIKFYKNDINIRRNNLINYSPKLIEYEKFWLKEEYFEGKPLNRLNSKKRTFFIKKICIAHWEQLILKTTHQISLKSYEKFIKSELIAKLEQNNKFNLKKKVLKLIDIIFNKLENNKIKISDTHGDFQESNMLVKQSKYKVIDWEHADQRYYLYDYFILFSNERSIKNILVAIKNFKAISLSEILNFELSDVDIYVFLIEEIRFSINENISNNFYESGKETNILCDQISTYLN